jgi:hypothetical protein
MWIPLLVLASLAPDSTCGSTLAPFAVHGQATTALVGEKQRLALWSNRLHTELRFEWRLIDSPGGTTQVVVQPGGVSTMSRDCEHAYSDCDVPNFTPDLPGLYVFEVRATELSTGQVAIGQGSMVVSAPSRGFEPGGCSAMGGWPLIAVGLLLLRRRHSSARERPLE